VSNAKKKDSEGRTRSRKFPPMSEITKPVMQRSGVYPMERHVPEFQAWNGQCGDSKERTAARRHSIDITKPLEQESGHPRPPYVILIAQSQAKLESLSRASAASSVKAKDQCGGVESTATLYFRFLPSRTALCLETLTMEPSGIFGPCITVVFRSNRHWV
jgi:hypothetical protein